MEVFTKFDTARCPLYILRGHKLYYKKCLNIYLAKTADADEMPIYAAFHVGLHCLLNTDLGFSNLQRVQ